MNDDNNITTDNINKYTFIHPLKYNENENKNSKTFITVSDSVKADLDLTSTQDETKIKLYDILLNNASNLAKTGYKELPKKTKSQQRVYEEITSHVFTDKKDIERSHLIIKLVGDSLEEDKMNKLIQQQEIIEKDILDRKLNSDFFDIYNYIDYKPLDFVNRSSKIMGFLNVYTLSSPLLSILMPLIILLVPFFSLKVNNVGLSFSNYFTFLKQLLSKVPAFRIFTFGANDTIGAKVSGLMGMVLYFVQMYYNFKYCRRYVAKNHDIHNSILIMKKVVNASFDVCEKLLNRIDNNKTATATAMNEYSIEGSMLNHFYNNLLNKKEEVLFLKHKMDIFENKYSVLSLNHINTIGRKLKIFYELVSDYKNIKDKLKTIFDLNTFCLYYKNIHINIKNGVLEYCSVNNNKTPKDNTQKNNTQKDDTSVITFTNSYFPMLLADKNKIVHNSISIDKSFIISGPNASGKTTVLKSVLFNILCTQQFGCGFYDSCKLNDCFSVIESYINIMDSHDRNSLFQNEALRMLELIKKVDDVSSNENRNVCGGKNNMFFIFDELFSGTNPKEASACGISSLVKLLNHSNVKFMLTTHYDDVCHYFNKKSYSGRVCNKKMKCHYQGENKNTIHYDYSISNGISKIYGGLNVLKELGYSSTIINDAHKILFNN